jgi:hypothetical protein
MRKHTILGLALLLVLATAGAAFADASHQHTGNSKYVRMHGTIDSMDSTGGTFTVKHGNDSSTFKTDSSTKYKHGTKTIAMTDLHTGDKVRVSYTEEGTDKTAAMVLVTDKADKDRR